MTFIIQKRKKQLVRDVAQHIDNLALMMDNTHPGLRSEFGKLFSSFKKLRKYL